MMVDPPSQLVSRELCMWARIASRPSCDGDSMRYVSQARVVLVLVHGQYCCATGLSVNAAEHRTCVVNSSASTPYPSGDWHSLASGLCYFSAVRIGLLSYVCTCVRVSLLQHCTASRFCWCCLAARRVQSHICLSHRDQLDTRWMMLPHVHLDTSSPAHGCMPLATNARFLYQCCHYYWVWSLRVEGQPASKSSCCMLCCVSASTACSLWSCCHIPLKRRSPENLLLPCTCCCRVQDGSDGLQA